MAKNVLSESNAGVNNSKYTEQIVETHGVNNSKLDELILENEQLKLEIAELKKAESLTDTSHNQIMINLDNVINSILDLITVVQAIHENGMSIKKSKKMELNQTPSTIMVLACEMVLSYLLENKEDYNTARYVEPIKECIDYISSSLTVSAVNV